MCVRACMRMFARVSLSVRLCSYIFPFSAFCLIDLILFVPSTIFQLNRDGSSWAEPVLSKDKMCLAQGPQRSDAG